MKEKRKKGLSEVISMLLIVLLTLAAITIIFMVIINRVNTTKEEIEILNILGMENVNIQKAVGDFKNGGNINITIKRIFSIAPTKTTKTNQTTLEKKPIDLVLVLDRSGSMQQSGWILETSLPPTNTTNLTVPVGAYSSIYLLNVPLGTQRLAVSINWNKVTGFSGSEGSEFALNLRRPDGTWIANNGNYPDELSGKVDPPNPIGTANEYFSGISTKPQYFYIENPQNGTWQAKVYGWNLRPKSSPPSTQTVSVQVYIGNSSFLNKSSTIISSDMVKNASKNFVDNLEEGNRVAVVRFGSCTHAELTQILSSNKTAIKNAIDNIGSEGGTCINDGIVIATQHLTTTGRSDALKIITMLTDGQNDLGPDPVIASAQQAKDENFTIFTIGMTHFVDEDMLKNIATEPGYYYYSDFNMLDNIYQQLSEKIVTIQQTKTFDVSLVILFLNNESSCKKEIDSSELPELVALKTFYLNLEGCIKNITKIEIYSKMKGKVGPQLDSIEVTP